MTKQRKQSDEPTHLRVIKVGVETVRWLGAIIPGAAYFYHYAPPYFPSAWMFGPVIGAAILLWGYYRRTRRRAKASQAVVFLLLAIVTLVLYAMTLKYCTVLPPGGREGGRRQIGFDMFSWSLTEKARDRMARLARGDDPVEVSTPNHLMLVFGVWGGEGQEDEIWHWWSINLAGILLIVLFLLAFAFWVYGFAVLLRFIQQRLLR